MQSERERKNQSTLETDLSALQTILENFSKSHDLTTDQLLSLLKEKESSPTLIPSCILRERKLGVLEATTKFLKENQKLRYRDIGKLLNKDDRVVWVTYNNAKKKIAAPQQITQPNTWLPLSVFTDKTRGPLESVVHYLKDHAQLSFNEIAKLLNRDNRVVWAVYHKRRDTMKKNKGERT